MPLRAANLGRPKSRTGILGSLASAPHRVVAHNRDHGRGTVRLQRRHGRIRAPLVRPAYDRVFGDRDGVIDYRWHSAWIQRSHDQALFKTLRGVGHMPHHVRAEVCVELLEQLVDTVSIVESKRTLVA